MLTICAAHVTKGPAKLSREKSLEMGELRRIQLS